MDIEKLKFTTTDGELPMEVNLSEMDQEIVSMLKTLRLPAMKESYMRMVASDELAEYTATELLYKLLSEQAELRRNNTGAKRAKDANLWMPDARLALLEEHEIHVNTFQLEQFAKFNFANHGGLLKELVSNH